MTRQQRSTYVGRQYALRHRLRIAMEVAWWERLIERIGFERWEALDRDSNRWRRYWRRHGSIPRWLEKQL